MKIAERTLPVFSMSLCYFQGMDFRSLSGFGNSLPLPARLRDTKRRQSGATMLAILDKTLQRANDFGYAALCIQPWRRVRGIEVRLWFCILAYNLWICWRLALPGWIVTGHRLA
jgi:hypothetical protein